jgi:hypothetical protein
MPSMPSTDIYPKYTSRDYYSEIGLYSKSFITATTKSNKKQETCYQRGKVMLIRATGKLTAYTKIE